LYSVLEDSERMQKLFDRTMQKYNLHIAGENMSKRAFIKKYGAGFFHCIDECYKDLYGVVPYTPEMQKQIVDQFMLILSLKYVMVVCDENEEVVAVGLCIPGIGKALQKSGGKLTPACLIRLMKAIKKPKTIDLALVGILPQYRRSGLSAFIITVLEEMLQDDHIEYMETNLNLETNTSIQAVWKNFDCIQHKRRRSYIKKL